MLLRNQARFRDRFVCSIDGGAGGGGGTPLAGGDPWYQPHVATLDKDTLSWLDGHRFGGVTDALKSGANAERLARDRNVITRPDPQKLGEWDGWAALGFEPDEGKYKGAVKPPKMPNNGQHDAELMDGFVKLAHGMKLPPQMAEGLYHGLTDMVNKRLEGAAAAGAKATADLEAALRSEWGADYDLKRETAVRAARTLGIGADDLAELEKITGAPRLLKLMERLGSTALEGRMVNADGTAQAGGALTPAAAEAELRRLEGDTAWVKVFTDPRHPQNADYKARYNQLIGIVAKGRKAA